MPTSPSLQLVMTLQCCLEGCNKDVAEELMTVTSTILRKWYAQRYSVIIEVCATHATLELGARVIGRGEGGRGGTELSK